MTFNSKPITLLLCLLLFTILAASAQKRRAPQKRPKPATASKHSTLNEQIKNGIIINSRGFKVAEAYLVFDDENPVPDDNKVALHQNVNMLLIIDSGWTETGGRVYPGSKQVLKLNNGVEILNSEELFAAFDETGVSPEDARYITLNTVVTELKDKKKHVVVNFRVWDKKGPSEITGSYKLFIK
ncbi:MAG: hypothetical protein ABIN67_15700 [Ferruginibacter sp.]